MKIPFRSIAILAMLAAGAPMAHAQSRHQIPDIAQALLDAAYSTGDAAEIAAVTKAVRAVFPDYDDPITAQTQASLAALAPPKSPIADEQAQTAAGLFAVSPWQGKAQASAAFSSGNSDTVSAGLLIDASREAGDFVHNVNAFVDIARSNGVTDQKRWGAAYQLDYKLSERTYAYARVSYEEDEFSGFDYRLFAGAGLGHFIYKSEPFKWKIEGGPGYRYSPIDISREINQDIAFYASSETDWLIREGVIFEQDFNVTWTAPTTTFQSITSLTTALTESISTGVSFEYRYETDPPPGRENADTIARANVVYGF